MLYFHGIAGFFPWHCRVFFHGIACFFSWFFPWHFPWHCMVFLFCFSMALHGFFSMALQGFFNGIYLHGIAGCSEACCSLCSSGCQAAIRARYWKLLLVILLLLTTTQLSINVLYNRASQSLFTIARRPGPQQVKRWLPAFVVSISFFFFFFIISVSHVKSQVERKRKRKLKKRTVLL